MATTITLENELGEETTYELATNLDDITLGEWVALMNAVSKREWKEIGKMALSDEILKELVDVDKETEEFKTQKIVDCLYILSNIPVELFTTFPSLTDELAQLVDWKDLMNDTSKPANELEAYEVMFKKINIGDCTFQQWCDFENFIGENMLIAFVVFLSNGKPYNRFHPDFEEKMMMFSRIPARGNAATLQSILDEIYKIRDDYRYVYSTEEVLTGENNYHTEEHHKLFKWEDVIVSIAETPMFTSEKGNLWAVRNANVLEVLDYLNIKRSKDLAELKDFKAKDKNKQIL